MTIKAQAVAQPAPPAQPDTLDQEIAEFLAENPAPEGEEPETEPETNSEVEPGDESAEDESEDGSPGDGSADDSDPPVDDSDSPEKPPAEGAFDTEALRAAVEANDPVAFVKALGDRAEGLLTGKAHRALRLQVKEFERAQTKASLLADQLKEKYGDPIAAREAAERGDVDQFLEMVEKWSGHTWNETLRWVTQGLAGRTERLERKRREAEAAGATEEAKREQATAELRSWIDAGVKKLAPELHDPDTVAMVEAEIRAGFKTGVKTPAAALPIVRRKLRERYERLHKLFGKEKRTPKREASQRVERPQVGGSTRELTLDEEIAEFLVAEGLPSSTARRRR